MQAWAFEHPYLTFVLGMFAIFMVAVSIEAIAGAISKRRQ